MSHASASPQGATGGSAVPPHPYKNKAIGLAVAAAVGGFLFGFDSSVINGAVDAIEGEFEIDPGRHRPRRRHRPAGLRVRRVAGRQARRPLGPHPGDVPRRGPVLRLLDPVRHRVRRLGPGAVARHGRHRHRHRVGHRAGVHRRDRPGGDARPAGLAPAARDHARYLRGPAVRPAARRRRRAARPRSCGSGSRPGAGCSSSRSSPPPCTASSRCGSRSRRATSSRPASARRPRRCSPTTLAGGRRRRGARRPDREHDRDGQEARVAGEPARARGSGCCRWCGSASCCRCSSSSSGST